MTFSDIFKSSFLESVTEFSAVDTLIGMLFALVIGLFIFLIYKKTFSGVMYSTGFAMSLVGLSLVTTLVIFLKVSARAICRQETALIRAACLRKPKPVRERKRLCPRRLQTPGIPRLRNQPILPQTLRKAKRPQRAR